jgi:adenylate kinase family enzyme
MRAVIIGNSGSGKSTLARLMAAASCAPLLDLDTIFWEPKQIAVARPDAAVFADLAKFCEGHEQWVIEGCYGNLAERALVYQPLLILLHPGMEACVKNCCARPWEPTKYGSGEQQDSYLNALLAWVAAYYERDGHMSLRGHQALFDAYTGPKQLLTALPSLASRN